jgi:hypothetical protein
MSDVIEYREGAERPGRSDARRGGAMSDTDDGGIGRRKVLAAAAGAGGLGLAGGVGSAALLRDGESFGALFGSGSLRLDVAWESVESAGASIRDGELTALLEPKDRDGSALLRLSLPGSSNNPAHVWFQPSCPEEPELADSLELDIYESNEDGYRGSPVIGGSLRDLAEREGTKLRFDGEECLDAGVTRYLLVEWEYTRESADFDVEDFGLNLFATQCRNNDTPRNPYDPRSCAESAGKDISWVAFCAESGETLTDADVSFSVNGDTLDLKDAPEGLATVVLKYGTEIRVFEQPGTSGTFTTTTGGTTYEQNTGNSSGGNGGKNNSNGGNGGKNNSNGGNGGKNNSNGGNGGKGNGSSFPGSGRTNSEPCPGTCGLKYEGDDGFEDPSSKGCNS